MVRVDILLTRSTWLYLYRALRSIRGRRTFGMTTPTNTAFRGTAVGLICCAIVLAFLNLYMNFLASRSSSSFQIDLTANGDVVAFHQFEFPGPAGDGQLANRRRRGRRRAATRAIRGHNFNVTTFCMGLCPYGSQLTQVDYVKTLIHARMKNLPSNTFKMDSGKNEYSARRDVIKQRVSLNASYLARLWRRTARWISPRNISAPDDATYGMLMDALITARIIRVATPTKGTQLKVMLLLEGRQWAVWKPKFFERSVVVEGGPTDGPDRHNGEIAAFYIGKLLGLNRTPFVVGRVLNVRSELMEVADKTLRGTFFQQNGTSRLCFYGQCVFCSPSQPACAEEEDDRLEGAMVLWFPPSFANLTRVRSPWARTYDPHRLATWQSNISFCRSVVEHPFFGEAPVFLDLMEMAVFDFLIGNADRHRLEFFKDHAPKTILLLDNGKSFGNPNVDELTILAPLYQCCRVRRRLYHAILKYSEINFGALLNDRYLKRDPLYPVLTNAHLEAVNRRLRKVLAVLASCMEQQGQEAVIIDDGY